MSTFKVLFWDDVDLHLSRNVRTIRIIHVFAHHMIIVAAAMLVFSGVLTVTRSAHPVPVTGTVMTLLWPLPLHKHWGQHNILEQYTQQ